METSTEGKDQLPVQAASEQDTSAAIETVKAVKPDAGLRSLDHYKTKLPSWRYAARQKLIPLIRWETLYVAKLQNAMRSPLLDSYFSITANLGTHTFFMIFLPVLFWCGYTNLGRGMVHILASGVFFSGFIKDMLCLPRPLSPPLSRISMSHSVSLEYGFPSTHSTNAVSVAVYAAFMLRSAGSDINPTLKLALEILSYCYATSIILGRLYCGMHGFFDVIVGGILGAVLSIIQCYYGEVMDDFVFRGSTMAPMSILLAILALVRIHPEPADDCPCFDDSVAFAGVIIGVELGNWHFATTDHAWELPVPATVPFDLAAMGWPRAVARIAVGVLIIFAWREVMKPSLLRLLPPLFRIVESFGLTLPRKFFVQASSRRESNLSTSMVRQTTKGQTRSDGTDNSYFGRTSSSNLPAFLRVSGLPTPAGSQADLYNSSLSSDVFVDGPLTPNTLASEVSTPSRRLSEDRRQYEREEKELFSMVEKPRVRYDVEVVTKLIVYTGVYQVCSSRCKIVLMEQSGIAWLAVEGNPLLFQLAGLGLGT
ncbi:MAG: hypothetical protein Q9181_002927 [Wetmoreana brouardii]